MLASVLSAPRCRGCTAPGTLVCTSCEPAAAAPSEPPPPGVHRLLSGWVYEGVGRRLILDLKLRGCLVSAGPLAAAVRDAAWRCGLEGEVVTWVPARPADIRRRGFDHGEVLARTAARSLGLPVRRLLVPLAMRRDQSALGAAERWTNLRDAFAARSCSRTIVVVDDLATTGATASACASALVAAGAARVEVVTACRAV